MDKTNTAPAASAAIEILKIAYQFVASTPTGMSSGELYIRLAAPLGWQDDRTYQALLAFMVRNNMVKNTAHWLTVLPLER